MGGGGGGQMGMPPGMLECMNSLPNPLVRHVRFQPLHAGGLLKLRVGNYLNIASHSFAYMRVWQAVMGVMQSNDPAAMSALMCSTSPCRTTMAATVPADQMPPGVDVSQAITCMCDEPAMQTLISNGGNMTTEIVSSFCASDSCRRVPFLAPTPVSNLCAIPGHEALAGCQPCPQCCHGVRAGVRARERETTECCRC
eukprot:890534-Prymnesium_polylepis.1